MGWTIPYHTHTRDQLVEWLLEGQHFPGSCEITDQSRRGNVLYVLFHNVPKQYRFIVVFFLEGPTPGQRKAGEQSWSYLDVDESQGPRAYDCPERLLRQSDAQYDNAVEWREKCRSERRIKAQRRKLSQTCQSGDRIEVIMRVGWNQDCDVRATVIFQRRHTTTYFVGKDLEGNIWRYRWDRVVVRDIATDTAKAVA